MLLLLLLLLYFYSCSLHCFYFFVAPAASERGRARADPADLLGGAADGEHGLLYLARAGRLVQLLLLRQDLVSVAVVRWGFGLW